MPRMPAMRRRIASSVIFVTILLDFIGFSILIPVLPKTLEEMGADAVQIGVVLALYVIALVLFLPPWGWISDRIGRKPVLLVCLAGTAFSFLMMAMADTIWEFYVARALAGIFGASVGTAQAYMTDITSSKDRTGGLGLVGAATSGGVIFGPALGAFLLSIDPTLPFIAPMIVALVAFAGALFFLPESRPPETVEARTSDFYRTLIPTPLVVFGAGEDRRTRFFLVLFLVAFGAFATIEGMFPLYAEHRFEWTPGIIGVFLSLIAVLIGSIQLIVVGPLSVRLGELRVSTLGLALAGAGLIGLGIAQTLPQMVAAAMLTAAGNGLWFPSFTSLYTKSFLSESDAGEYLARSVAMSQTGRGLGIILGGVAHQYVGVGWEFSLAGIVVFATLAGQFLGLPLLLSRS